jgi:metal-responsive CopG/Arc/MetJ family transcriptional regulator
MTTRISNNKRGHISISIRKELIDLADEVARELNTNRSAVITSCLEELARKRKEQLMIKYYRSMNSEQEQFLTDVRPSIGDIVKDWGK